MTIPNRLNDLILSLKRPYLQIQLHSEVLRVWISTCKFGGWGHNSVHNVFFCVFSIVPLSHTHTRNTTALADLEGNTLIMVTWPFSDLCSCFWAGSASGISFVPQIILLWLRIHCFGFFGNEQFKLWYPFLFWHC